MDPCCVWKWWFHHKHVDLRNKMWEENGIIWETTWYLGVSENGESPNLGQNRSQLHGLKNGAFLDESWDLARKL